MSKHYLDLAHEFPSLKERIAMLLSADDSFRRLHEHYEELNQRIERLEKRLELDSELAEEKLRKERLKLKDQLYQALTSEHR